MQATAELGGPTWFKLGDRDLATHVERTRRLAAGETLTGVTGHLAERLGIAARILPMADAPVRTVVESDAGTLAFQEYFVRDQCRPVARSIRYDGAARARPTRAVIDALSAPGLAGIIICPSNPWLSVDPILAVPGLREAMRASGAPVIAVSPIIGGKAVKGPTAKIMGELGLTPTAATIARHYGTLLDGFVLDAEDEALAGEVGVATIVTSTMMRTTRRQGGAGGGVPVVLRPARQGRAYRSAARRNRGGAMSATWAIVPVKALGDAKQRLAAVLPVEARRRLMLVMLHDVLAALQQVETLGPIVIVSPDPHVARDRRARGPAAPARGALTGHSAAVAAGLAFAKSHGATRALTLPADVPLVTADEIARARCPPLRGEGGVRGSDRGQASAPHPRPSPHGRVGRGNWCARLASRDGDGSNAIVFEPLDALDSELRRRQLRAPHARSRPSAASPSARFPFPGIGLDIDSARGPGRAGAAHARARALRLPHRARSRVCGSGAMSATADIAGCACRRRVGPRALARAGVGARALRRPSPPNGAGRGAVPRRPWQATSPSPRRCSSR